MFEKSYNMVNALKNRKAWHLESWKPSQRFQERGLVFGWFEVLKDSKAFKQNLTWQPTWLLQVNQTNCTLVW